MRQQALVFTLCLIVMQALPAWPRQVPAPADPEAPDGAETAQELPRARNIDLDEPVTDAEAPSPSGTAAPLPFIPDQPAPDDALPAGQSIEAVTAAAAESPAATPGPAAAGVDDPVAPLVILGSEVAPGTSTRLNWLPAQSFEGVFAATPVMIVHGARTGPVLCLTAAVHGDELNGIETVRRVMYGLDPAELAGTVIGVPIVNLQGFHRSSRYLADRRDLNRHFPGDPEGSLASRIAHSFFSEVVERCDTLVDLHTGSYHRTNMPQLRADLHDPEVMTLTRGFGATVVLHSDGALGTLRRAATEAGVPAVTLEAGGSMLLDERSVEHSYQAIRSLLHHMQMVSKFSLWGQPEPVFYRSSWQRAPVGGVIFSNVKLGARVAQGELLGTITNPITNVRTELRSQYTGRILGMALNQFVQPGFAAYHIGIQAPPEVLRDTLERIDAVPSDGIDELGANDYDLPDEDPVEAPLED